jgi:hypothetical protein
MFCGTEPGPRRVWSATRFSLMLTVVDAHPNGNPMIRTEIGVGLASGPAVVDKRKPAFTGDGIESA